MSKVAVQFIAKRQQLDRQETVPVKVNAASMTALDKIDAFFQKVSFCGLVFKIRRVFVAVMLLGAVAAASRLKLKPMHRAIPIILGIGFGAMQYEPKKRDVSAESIEIKEHTGPVEAYAFQAKAIASFSDTDYATHIAKQTRKQWLELSRTILCNHQGMVQLEKKSYQIRQCHGYSKWAYKYLSEITGKPYFNAVMMKLPSYLEAIPEHLRQPDPEE